MTYEQIETTIQEKNPPGSMFEIRFKTRNPVVGLFIKTADYGELSRKNLWRIVNESHIAEYKQTKNESLARIFNGTEFTRLVVLSAVGKPL